jgi:hypothetical protein
MKGRIVSGFREPAIAELARLRDAIGLRFPIADKTEFGAQMTAHAPRLEFVGKTYDTEFVAELIPSFLFPLSDSDDLMHKAQELLLARGLTKEPG